MNFIVLLVLVVKFDLSLIPSILRFNFQSLLSKDFNIKLIAFKYPGCKGMSNRGGTSIFYV